MAFLYLCNVHVGDARRRLGARRRALGRGALPRLKGLSLSGAAIGDAGLVALAPALRRLPALERLALYGNPFGDEGLAALVAPPPTAGVLTKLKVLDLGQVVIDRVTTSQSSLVAEAGCAALAAALDSGALPALNDINLSGIPASAAAKAAVQKALITSKAAASS